jgi:hypothetical protein
MPKISHDPVRQGELQEEQWFADLIGGMLRRSQHPTNVYSYDRMMNIYGGERGFTFSTEKESEYENNGFTITSYDTFQ